MRSCAHAVQNLMWRLLLHVYRIVLLCVAVLVAVDDTGMPTGMVGQTLSIVVSPNEYGCVV